MSAFVVRDKTINSIVNWLSRHVDDMTNLHRQLWELGVDTESEGWQKQLARMMSLLNEEAVYARYGKSVVKSLNLHDFHYNGEDSASAIQVFKSLQCWLYQCSESYVPQTPLYQLFDRDIQRYLMESIILNLDEYQQAEWG